MNKIIGVDFDGTLAITKGTYPRMTGANQEIIDYILDEQKKGAYIILITMREGNELGDAVEWCRKRGLEFDAVNDNLPIMKDYFSNNPRKIFCNEYLDDTNIGGIETVLEEIRKRKEK